VTRRVRIGLAIAAAGIAFLLLLLVVVTQTDPGRELVRRQIVSILNDNSHGIVRVEGLSGNLLTGVKLHGVSITDSARRPLLLADTIESRYGLRAVIGRRIELSGLRVVNALILLEQWPGEKWNFERIFPRDTLAREPTKRGWGTWIRFNDVTLLNTRFVARVPWELPQDLSPAERERAVTAALGVENRVYVERVPGGFQRVSDFRAIDAHLPLVRLADPNEDHALIEISSLRTAAYPFRPPGLHVRALTGELKFDGDSLWWDGLRAVLAESRVAVDGRYTVGNGDLSLRVVGNPFSPRDIRWAFPQLPETGSGRLEFAMDWIGDRGIYVARNVDVRMDGAHLRGHIHVTDEDTLAFHPGTDIRFAGLRTELLQRVLDMELPLPGTLTGHARFEGGLNALQVNGDVVYVTRGGSSHLQGDGIVGFPGDDFTFRNLRVRMDPLTMDLAETIIPDIPFGGSFTGLAEVNGSTASVVRAVGDVTHIEAGRRSRAIGTVAVRPHPVSSWFDVDARFAPLSLATVGTFAPALELRGFVSGPFAATGTVDDFTVNTSLAASGAGNIRVNGRLALGGRSPGYDLRMNALLFDAAAVSSRAPSTSITATAHARGVGSDLATMRGELVADFATSRYDTVGVDSGKVRIAVADGLARVDTLAVHLPQGLIEASGTLGLVEHREGELAYRVVVDSLGTIAPREEDVMGTLYAEGIARGSIRRLGLEGTAWGDQVMARGHYVDRFTARYTIGDLFTPQARINVQASASTALLSGFEFDTVSVSIDHSAGRGQAQLSVRQDDLRVYAADANYVLHADHNELHLNDLMLQFDTTVWQSTQPSAVQWGGRGVEIEGLELTAGEGRRVFVEGRLPTAGSADLHVIAERFEIGDLAALLQTNADLRGMLSFDMRAQGTPAAPTLSGNFVAEDFLYRNTGLPRVTGTFTYSDETITGNFDARRLDGSTIVSAEGAVPINLALSGVTGSRIPLDRQISVQVAADSFPVGIIPGAEEFVADVTARTVGSARVVGTIRNPQVEGAFSFVDGGARIVPLGIRLGNIAGHIRLSGDTIVIDSIAGTSATGPVRISGGLGVRTLTEPSFDLSFRAQNARVLDNEHGRLTADAELALYGEFRDARLSGGVRVRRGVLSMPEPDDRHVIGMDDPALWNVVDTAVSAERELFPTQSPLLANLEVDVSVRVDRDVFVRSNDANVEVYTDGDLLVNADRAREILTLDGILLTERGDYMFLQKRFRVRRGSATFTGTTEINPILQGMAEYEVRLPAREALMIQVVVSGTMRSPRIELRSTAQPPISQSDLLSYLAFGRSSSSLTQLEGTSLTGGGAGGSLIGQGAAVAMRQLATVAVGQMTDELAGEAARALGADVFIITPADVQTDVGNFLRTTEIEFGRYVRPATFIALQFRPDPEALRRPGFHLEHRFARLQGYQFRLSLEPRYILQEPTLGAREPRTRSVFGAFVIREWRY
jgi:translocation and assembly module TamB